MVTLLEGILVVHVGAGVGALLAGLVALATEKGSPPHRRAGRYFVGLLLVTVSMVVALFTLQSTPLRQFFTAFGILACYLALSGYRALSRQDGTGAGALDWLLALVVGLGAIGLAWLVVPEGPPESAIDVAPVLACGVLVVVVVADLRAFRLPDRLDPWIVSHLNRMIGAYVVALTSASVFVLSWLPTGLAWVWPAALGFPLAWLFAWKYGDAGPIARLVPW